MHTETVHVLGAGGHSRVTIDALQLLGYQPRAIRVYDDRRDLHGTSMLGCSIEQMTLPLQQVQGWVHAAVGSGSIRQRLLERSGLAQDQWLTIVHPRSCVSKSASLASAAFVAAQSVIGPCARIGTGVIVNHGAVVDHDCHIGAFSHVAPCASLGGEVHIGVRVLIGAGARILPGVRIGDDAVIGAGAVVLNDVAPSQTWMGVPARFAYKENK